MTLDWAAILNSGFLLFFAVAVMRAVGKYGPDFLYTMITNQSYLGRITL